MKEAVCECGHVESVHSARGLCNGAGFHRKGLDNCGCGSFRESNSSYIDRMVDREVHPIRVKNTRMLQALRAIREALDTDSFPVIRAKIDAAIAEAKADQ